MHEVSARPGRGELGFIADVAAEVLPRDTAPTPADIGKSNKVDPLGAPQLAPQQPEEPLRLIVCGADAGLAAVATHLMRKNLGWVELAYCPGQATPATRNWDLGEGLDMAAAVSLPVRPVPLIRDDTGAAIVGFALLTEPGIAGTSSRGGFSGEVWVDEHMLFSGTSHGVQVRPTPSAPGLVAAEVPPPDDVPSDSGWWARLRGRGSDPNLGLTDVHGRRRAMHAPMTGRAVQAGGPGFRYVRDGIETRKPRDKVTLYRHLRDLQLVR
ncbi:hypothetical protein KRX51_08705 [Corynebacterium sp. TAE3-ERU12]|nr:hypothetical protein [Corynebacterium sp. TAE3-ERU12]